MFASGGGGGCGEGGEGGEGGSEGGEGSEGGSEGGEGGAGGSGSGGGASCWIVTSVFTQAEPHVVRHVERPCGGEEETVETWYA